MGVNKVMAKGEVVLDLTQDTVTPYTLAIGAIAHNAAGDKIIGVGGLNVSAIDDAAGDGDYDVAWSADKVYNELSDIKSRIATGGIHNEGAWSAETSYTKFAVVTNSGSSYLALEDVPAGTSLSNTDYWLKLSDAGGPVNIDDTAGVGDTTVTWSANKIKANFNDKADVIICNESGNPVSISDGAPAPVISMTVGIVPAQAGGGIPSPDNVRSITGWTGCNLSVNDTAYPISWQSEAGTVYGGTLDILTGVLTVTHGFAEFDGSSDEAWGNPSAGRCSIEISDAIHDGPAARKECLCNIGIYSSGASTVGVCFMYTSSGKFFYYAPAEALTSKSVFMTWLSTHHLQVVYSLNNPLTYQLTPNQVSTLLGKNLITADAGTISMQYYADTKKYIDDQKVFYYFPSLETGRLGNSCLVVTETKTLLFDTNPNANWELEKNWLDGLLADGKFSNIDYVIISHYHHDHCANFANIMDRYPHENVQVYIPMDAEPYKPTEDPGRSNWNYEPNRYTETYNYCVNNNINFTVVTTNMVLPISEEEDIDVTLWNSTVADYNYYKLQAHVTYNDYSMIAIFRHGYTKSLFIGDLQRRGEIRVLERHNVPKVWMWSWNHHGVQNDDFIPFYKAISPDYSVIQRGAYNATKVDDTYVYTPHTPDLTHLYFTSDDKTLLANTDCVLVSTRYGGQKISGKTYHHDFDSRKIEVYVDNSYTGDLCDGSEEHPYKTIGNAILNLPDIGIRYIYVKATTTPYSSITIYNVKDALLITGVPDEQDNLPIIENVTVNYNSGYLRFSDIKFSGSGTTSIDNYNCQAAVRYSDGTVTFKSCVFDGTPRTEEETFTDIIAICGMYSSVTINGCEFINYYYCFRTNEWSKLLITNNVITVTDCEYFANLSNLDIVIKAPSFTMSGENHTPKLFHNTGWGHKLTFSNPSFDYTLLSNLGSQKYVSLPFYYDSTNPIVVASGSHIYNILTGETVL